MVLIPKWLNTLWHPSSQSQVDHWDQLVYGNHHSFFFFFFWFVFGKSSSLSVVHIFSPEAHKMEFPGTTQNLSHAARDKKSSVFTSLESLLSNVSGVIKTLCKCNIAKGTSIYVSEQVTIKNCKANSLQEIRLCEYTSPNNHFTNKPEHT